MRFRVESWICSCRLGLAIAKLLGFDLCPRQHDMRHQWLHLPRGWPEVPGLGLNIYCSSRPACSPNHPRVVLYTEGFDRFVTSAATPIATGWRGSCPVGLSPTEKAHVFTAHGNPGYRAGKSAERKDLI
jgi:hypothetical protein